MSLIKVEPSGLHEEGIEEEERPVAGGRPEQSGDEMKQEQPAAPKETSEPDIPSFRYVERGARMYNVPLAIYHSPRNTCASHRYMIHASLVAHCSGPDFLGNGVRKRWRKKRSGKRRKR